MIRVAKIEDLENMVEIYNQAIDAKFQTAFTEKYRPEDKTNWFYEHPEDRYPLFVY
jgi:L-amino acid N-acyltransferase YncA